MSTSISSSHFALLFAAASSLWRTELAGGNPRRQQTAVASKRETDYPLVTHTHRQRQTQCLDIYGYIHHRFLTVSGDQGQMRLDVITIYCLVWCSSVAGTSSAGRWGFVTQSSKATDCATEGRQSKCLVWEETDAAIGERWKKGISNRVVSQTLQIILSTLKVVVVHLHHWR